MQDPTPAAIHWRRNILILVASLLIWFSVSYLLGIVFVEELNEYHIGGFPLGFWFAQQGSIYVFVLLILAYAILLDRLDTQYHRTETREESTDT